MHRRHDLDWVRVCAFGLLVLYHVGMYYVSWEWHVKSPAAGIALEPLMLLTNEPLNRSYRCLWHMVQAYLKRWAIEETIRYAKTCYDLENVRVLTYQSLQNLMPLVTAAMYFAACVLDHDARLRVMAGFVERAAKRLFGIPDFKYYALADGLRALFARHPGKPVAPGPRNAPRQMDLFAYDSS